MDDYPADSIIDTRTPEPYPESDEVSPTPGKSLRRYPPNRGSRWLPAFFPLLLISVVFLLIVFWPLLCAKQLHQQLLSTDPVASQAAREELIRRGGRWVYAEMINELCYGEEQGRLQAIQILGELGNHKALKALAFIAEDPDEPAILRAAAREAIVNIKLQ
ncbi:MAG: hypothetical protein JXA52_09995 [Planctomycetes bacterium]|nr:hypothetical protein [Planctomycetota bacterium]